MKKILLIIISTITFAFTTQAQNVNIPDSKFKAYLVGRKDSINTNKDTEISVAEAEAFTGIINVSNKGITSLTGIESFVNLTYLECNDNQLTTLDISKNTALKSLICYWNVLTTLIIQNNSALVYLDCHFNKLKNLDLSTSPALTDIWCSYNDLTTLNLNNNSSLKYLWCQNMKLTNLDLSNNLLLTTLYCTSNPNLICIGVSPSQNKIDWHKDNFTSYSSLCVTSIEENTSILTKTIVSIYNLQGLEVNNDCQGLVIYKFTDGTTQKAMQK